MVRENKLETAYIRPLVFYGSEGMGIRADNLKVHVVIAAWHWGAYMGEEEHWNAVSRSAPAPLPVITSTSP
ncbi:hypothetical protein ULG90_10945 [Halopseudomonas pachastrellae]|nr:hypothetical protein ULG90_10945 [Halopseudomonas pachastrellae]